MAVFRYTGIRVGDEKKVRGVLDAESEREARRILKSKKIYPTELLQQQARHPSLDGPRRQGALKKLFAYRQRPNSQEIIIFTRQLAGLLAAGFSVVNALRSVEEQLQSHSSRGMIVDIRNAVVEGQSLSAALALYPETFSPTYRSLVEAGEASGALETVLERLAGIMENQQRLRGRLISAMIYPLVLLTTGLVVVSFLLSVVVPKIVIMFQDSNQALPLLTRSLIVLSRLVSEWGVVLAVGLGVSSLALVCRIKTRQGRLKFEDRLFRLPFFKTYLRQLVTLRLTQTLGLLLTSGVPVLRSLQVAAKTTGFLLMAQRMKKVVRRVEQGEGIAQALAGTDLVAEISLRMIQTGEQAGNLEKMLERIARMQDENMQRTTERIMNFMEPAIVLILGAIVAYVVVAVLLPIFEMNQLIR